MTFNTNMHKKIFHARQNNTPLAGTLEKFLSFPFSSQHSSSSSVQFYFSVMTILVKSPLYCLMERPHFFFAYINIFISLSPALSTNSYSEFVLQVLQQKRHFPLIFLYPVKAVHTYTWKQLMLLSPGNCYYMFSVILCYPGYSVLCSLCYFLWVATSSLKTRTLFHLPQKTLVHTALIQKGLQVQPHPIHFGLIYSSLCFLKAVGFSRKSKTHWAQGMENQRHPQVENEVQRQKKWMWKKSQRKRDMQMRSGRCQHSGGQSEL